MAEGKENKPLHVLAEEAIKKMIRLPEYQNGKLLPNEIELARNLNISRNTLRQAINKMVFEGLLCRRKGYGTWVAKKTITGGVKNWLSFSQEMQRLGITIKNYELHVSLEYPDEKVRRFFGLDEEGKAGTLCLKLERVRGHAEYPFVVFISYFNPRFPISSDDNFTMPLYELLEPNTISSSTPPSRRSRPGWPASASRPSCASRKTIRSSSAAATSTMSRGSPSSTTSATTAPTASPTPLRPNGSRPFPLFAGRRPSPVGKESLFRLFLRFSVKKS